MSIRSLLSKRAFAALTIGLLSTAALALVTAGAAGAAVTHAASTRPVASAARRSAAPGTSICGIIVVNSGQFQRCTGAGWVPMSCAQNKNYNGGNGPWNVVAAANGCTTRVWLHQDDWNGVDWGTGWSLCISRGAGESIPVQFQHPLNIYVSTNRALC
jgi:hypothetical protein